MNVFEFKFIPQDSNFSTYQKMWAAMEAQRPTVFTASNQEGKITGNEQIYTWKLITTNIKLIAGVERVIKGKGNYAFLMESTSIEYTIERNCDLTQVGGMLDSKGWVEEHWKLLK